MKIKIALIILKFVLSKVRAETIRGYSVSFDISMLSDAIVPRDRCSAIDLLVVGSLNVE